MKQNLVVAVFSLSSHMKGEEEGAKAGVEVDITKIDIMIEDAAVTMIILHHLGGGAAMITTQEGAVARMMITTLLRQEEAMINTMIILHRLEDHATGTVLRQEGAMEGMTIVGEKSSVLPLNTNI